MNDDLLPSVLGEIADVAGIAAALAIADKVGGTRINIPARVQDDHWLVETVGARPPIRSATTSGRSPQNIARPVPGIS